MNLADVWLIILAGLAALIVAACAIYYLPPRGQP